ncbi:hypothetical protein TraAM80_03091 [Trypanosoma rangeli]|uniref:KATNIP domain-containing protein n=1 Tax=Trypanosoma rangeli TaxID=5698 RepID=A0A3R7M2D8_TRYRA|nr:uncharacterized protein TraAM80_03091 [Trypanosoma rangeli]RNF07812.1 hypothetical protein TraAM80_03091 [Trypanosoma rangeli]|eukprot:RNF07812.1 hypothetical protein TraAM80_03091 [Trypanosoma rangeli]
MYNLSPGSGPPHALTGPHDGVGEGQSNFDSSATHQSSSYSEAPGTCGDHAMGQLSCMGLPTHLRTFPPPVHSTSFHDVGGGAGECPEPLGQCSMNPVQRYSDNLDCRTSETIPFSAESPRVGPSSSISAIATVLLPPETRPVQHNSDDDGSRSNTASAGAYLTPEMPQGRFIVVSLLSTWGDVHEVGINGIEVFNENGERLIPPPECLRHSLSPPLPVAGEGDESAPQERIRVVDGHYAASYITPQRGLTVMVEYPAKNVHHLATAAAADVNNEVPRCRVENLVNGIHNTHDDTKLFVMPFTPNAHHQICFVLPRSVVISMVRVHNYGGRGRVHTDKGVRLLEMTVDDKLVFRGEIVPNNGAVLPLHRVGLENCENILFTEDSRVLRRLLAVPPTEAFVQDMPWRKERATAAEMPPHGHGCVHRSATIATVLFGAANEDKSHRIGGERGVVVPASLSVKLDEHPFPYRSTAGLLAKNTTSVSGSGRSRLSRSLSMHSGCPTDVTSICFFLLCTWGDTEQIGLSGLRFRDAQGNMVSQHISHWYVMFPSQAQAQISDEVGAWEDNLVYLFDENAETALTLPFEPCIELIFVFDAPLPTLGFVEVANYSLGEHTFSGVKEARLFVSSATPGWSPSALVAAYSTLWSENAEFMQTTLTSHGIVEVTPEAGVSLRKAPAFLSIPRFQVYDLSLSTGLRAMAAGNVTLHSSLMRSLSASMNIRAEMALRRARMSLKPRPQWLLEYQTYLTPLLPVAYVLKVSLLLGARSAVELKKYAKEWMMHPLSACTFTDENGETIRVSSRAGEKRAEDSFRDAWDGCGKEASHTFVTECLFTVHPTALQEDAEAAAAAAQAGIHASVFQASLSLVYVSDSPFCLSILTLKHPLLQEGGDVAWVRQFRIFMDDTLVFDSGDVGGPRRAPLAAVSKSPFLPGTGDAVLPMRETGSTGDTTYSTRLKPFVFFTLDAAMPDEACREGMGMTG